MQGRVRSGTGVVPVKERETKRFALKKKGRKQMRFRPFF
jgi:hypothetical protein